jgi:hypothetical protein
VNEIARAFWTGHHRGPGARAYGSLVFLLRARDSGERDRGIRQVHDDIDIFGIEPSARDRRAHVGLVLMVGGDDFGTPSVLEKSSTASWAATTEPTPW